jgi:hypothetical protein
MAGDGTIPALRIGETWRFDRREIERWLRGEGPALPAARAETPAPSSPASRGRWARWWAWFTGRTEETD